MTVPNFLIIGERRCGTTSLYHWMRAHPDVHLYPKPDLNYFVEDELNTRTWFDGEANSEAWQHRHNFEEYAALFRGAQGYKAIGHKGADLLFWKPAHARMACYLPDDVRFIVILRHPVKRAWSHYWNEVGKGRERLSFEESIAAERARSARSAYARFHLSYITRGFYDRSLEAFFETFSPKRVLVVTLKECQREPLKVLRKIYSFLGINPDKGLELAGKRYNENPVLIPRDWATVFPVSLAANAYGRLSEAIIRRLFHERESRNRARRYLHWVFCKPAARIRIPRDLFNRLLDLYAPHIEALEAMLNAEFRSWKK